MDNDTAQSVFPNHSVRRIVRLFLALFLGLAQVLTSWAQESGAAGALRLRVFDQDWDAPLPDATASIVENGMKRASDESGNVLFDTLPEGAYTVVVGASGFERKVLSSVTVVGGTVRTEDVRLHAEFTDMDEFVVKDVDFSIGGSEMAQLEIRSQSSSIMDNIGADMMSKAGVSTAAAALRLVTGTSVQDGKYAVIRGLGDRYTSTLLNGVRLPTSDKDRRAVQMDQFPAAMIESIQVTKTFMPDQQGDASGGGINIVTRGVPQKSILSASISTEYDSEATGNGNFKTYMGGGNDFGGLRGIENVAFWNSGGKETPRGNGEKYSSKIEAKSPSPNHGFKFAAGDVWSLGENASAGVLLNGSYSEKYKYRESVKNGTRNQGGTKGTNVITDVEDVTHVYTSTDEQLWSLGATMGIKNENNEIKLTGLYTHLSRDIVELRYDDLTPMEHPATTTNMTRGKITGYQDDWHRGRAVKGVMQYSETGNGSLQLAGKHTLEPLHNTEFDWTGAYNVSETIEPDRRAFAGDYLYNHTIIYDKNHNETSNSDESSFDVDDYQRRWLDTREQSFQGQLNAKIPYSVLGNDGYVKSGVFGDYLDRTFRNRVYNYSSVSGLSATDEYDFSQFGTLDDQPLPNLHDSSIEYDGNQELTAYYLMARAPLPERVDLIGGFRVESTMMETDIWTPGQDTIWLYRVGRDMADPLTYGKVYYQSNVDPAEGATAIDEIDVLPAIALNLKPVTDFSLRLTYAETIARPTFKEITPVLYQEFDSSKYFLGNPDLDISSLKNYDARVEWHPPKSADVVAASYFYKAIKDPIQYTTYKLFTGGTDDYIVPENYGKGEVSGFELEGRKGLDFLGRRFAGLSAGVNATFQTSSVEYGNFLKESLEQGDVYTSSRKMDGQPDVLYNLNLVYAPEDAGLTLGLFYNLKGETYVAGESWSPSAGYVPNTVELPVDTVDFAMSYRFRKHWKVGFDVKNIFAPTVETVYRGAMGELPNTSYRSARTFGFSLGCEW